MSSRYPFFKLGIRKKYLPFSFRWTSPCQQASVSHSPATAAPEGSEAQEGEGPSDGPGASCRPPGSPSQWQRERTAFCKDNLVLTHRTSEPPSVPLFWARSLASVLLLSMHMIRRLNLPLAAGWLPLPDVDCVPSTGPGALHMFIPLSWITRVIATVTERSLWARPCLHASPALAHRSLTSTLPGMYCSHYSGEKTEAQRGKVTCPSTLSWSLPSSKFIQNVCKF